VHDAALNAARTNAIADNRMLMIRLSSLRVVKR